MVTASDRVSPPSVRVAPYERTASIFEMDAPAGTKTTPSLPPLTVDQIYVDGGLNNNYYPVTCSPK